VLLPDVLHNEEVVKRFKREAAIGARLDHPNIINAYDFSTFADGRHYFVMPLLDGESVEDLCQRAGPLLIEEAFKIVVQACNGVHAAHLEGVVHRDLKPSNLFVTPTGLKVLDFGSRASPTRGQPGARAPTWSWAPQATCRRSKEGAPATSTTAPTSTRSAASRTSS
jgi:serine/threonine-protein kinase